MCLPTGTTWRLALSVDAGKGDAGKTNKKKTQEIETTEIRQQK